MSYDDKPNGLPGYKALVQVIAEVCAQIFREDNRARERKEYFEPDNALKALLAALRIVEVPYFDQRWLLMELETIRRKDNKIAWGNENGYWVDQAHKMMASTIQQLADKFHLPRPSFKRVLPQTRIPPKERLRPALRRPRADWGYPNG